MTDTNQLEARLAADKILANTSLLNELTPDVRDMCLAMAHRVVDADEVEEAFSDYVVETSADHVALTYRMQDLEHTISKFIRKTSDGQNVLSISRGGEA